MQGRQAGLAEKWPSVHSVPLGLALMARATLRVIRRIKGVQYCTSPHLHGRPGSAFKMKNYAFQQPLQHCVGGRLALSDAKGRRSDGFGEKDG
jgi:hypothetical protein